MSQDQFSRLEALIGPGPLELLHSSRVLICGVGAVGSMAFETLARSGIGHIRIADFDTVEESNINRQLIALHSTIGRKKVEAARERALDIWEGISIEVLDTFVDEDNCRSLIDGVDAVLDCMDTVSAKAALITACQERGIWIISSMGAALRRDLTRIRPSTLDRTTGCPLARAVRGALRKKGASLSVPVVYSDEPVDFDYGANMERKADGRRKSINLGSLNTVTAVFGCHMAHQAMTRLLSGQHGLLKE